MELLKKLMLKTAVGVLRRKLLISHRRSVFSVMKGSLCKWSAPVVRKLFLKIVSREKLLNNSGKYRILQFGSDETIVLNEPHNSSDTLPRIVKEAIGTFNFPKPFVAEVENAELVGSTAAGFDKDGGLISETINSSSGKFLLKKLPPQALVLKQLPGWGVPQLDTACSLVNSKGYFHWLIDGLLRIQGVEYYQERTGRKPILLIDSNPKEWHIESLKLLGYEPDDYMCWNHSKVKVKRLVVSSFRRKDNLMSPAACNWLRQRVFSNLPNCRSTNLLFSPRVYISRTKITGRQIINEDEVLQALAHFGFVTYTLENMSFSDEVRLFSQAEIVVAPHGAGLTNIVFAQDLSVIDLFGPFGTPCFFVLAKILGFSYGCLGPGPIGKNKLSDQYKGITVDIPKLRDLVAEMLDVHSNRKHVNLIDSSSVLKRDGQIEIPWS